jgi:hypothetical protein
MDTHTRIKSTRFLTAATTFALAALILPMGLTGASAQTLPVTITVNSATVNQDGTATIVYTVSCSEPTTITQATLEVKQSSGKWGSKQISGSDSTFDIQCDQSGTQISETVVANTGFFTSGRAALFITVHGCTEFECGSFFFQEAIRLRR